MDGFEPNSGVIVMGATNLESALDPALMRAGRFDRHVAVPLPDVHGRLEVLTYYLQVSRVYLLVKNPLPADDLNFDSMDPGPCFQRRSVPLMV